MDKEVKGLQAYVEKKILKRLKEYAKKCNDADGKNVFGNKMPGIFQFDLNKIVKIQIPA